MLDRTGHQKIDNMNLDEFNHLNESDTVSLLSRCCGSARWASLMQAGRPYRDPLHLAVSAASCWYDHCGADDWMEAFTHHPRIGDVASLRERFPSTAELSSAEQAGITAATDDIIEKLAEANDQYFNKNGFIFIVCATGKPAEEMLALVTARLENDPAEEFRIAMGEQHKITMLRLKNAINAQWSTLPPSHITTHVLDTSTGNPASGVSIVLQDKASGYLTFAQGITNHDGRIPDLIAPGKMLSPGRYKMVFDTGKYYGSRHERTFYPVVPVFFEIFDESHYHIPLLLSPFGYTTYRGS